MMKLCGGVDVLVVILGCLLDLEYQNVVKLDQVEIFVFDEVDCMFDMGFIYDICCVLIKLFVKRQNLLFFVIFFDDIKVLVEKLLYNLLEIEVVCCNIVFDQVIQYVYFVDKKCKCELLLYMIGKGNWQQVLVFICIKYGVNYLVEQFNKDGICSAVIYGNKL